MSRDIIKYIAMFTMLLNHVAVMFLKPGTFSYETLVDIGYFTAVTMCYFLVEGYHYTRSIRAYRNRILLFAVISQLPFCLAFSEHGIVMNMMVTLYLCLWIIEVLYKAGNPLQRGLMTGVLLLLTMFCDWPVLAGLYVIFFVQAGESAAEKRRAYGCAALVLGITVFVTNIELYTPIFALASAVGSALAVSASGVCVLHFYNGKQAEKGRTFSKWFFYIFYPLHLLILVWIRSRIV